ncbi:MAG: hypothetical protein GY821_00100 [Gammaproteobacteria bacterium]|nr:hypothetical protein [Gammaproteobacteria bacterium]
MSSNANNQQPNAEHQYKDVQGVWCESHQVFVTERKYDLAIFKPLLMQHFQEGGWPSVPIMAGVCGVSDDMFRLWLDRESKYYKPALDEFIAHSKTASYVVLDKWHRESASGARKEANASTLNRRMERILNADSTRREEKETEFTGMTIEELDEKIEYVRQQQLAIPS